jgi:acetolactate synthase I/II/III large subunit
LLCGDGALAMHIMELETAIRHSLPLVVILNDDQAFAAELQALDAYMGAMPETMFADVRFDQIVKSMGGHAEYVETADAIQPAIKRAFASGKTALVQIKTDQLSGIKYPPFSGMELYSWVHEDASVMKDS